MKIRKIAQTPGLVATVVDNLESDSRTDALSARMGKNLNEKNVMTASLSANASVVANEYTNIRLNASNVTGDKLTLTSDGGIRIGSGISRILVGGSVAIAPKSNGLRHLRIIVNNIDNTVAWNIMNFTANIRVSMVAPSVLVNVQEGDIIYLAYYTADGTDTLSGGTYGNITSLTVEAIK